MVVEVLAREAAVGLLELEHTVEQRAYLLLPCLVTSAVELLVAEKMEHGVDAFALLTDAVDYVLVGWYGLVEAYLVLEVAAFGEAVCEVAVEDGAAGSYDVRLACLLAIFNGVEAVEDGAAAEAELSGGVGLAVVTAESVA